MLPTDDMSKVKISGLGLKSGICTQSPQTFIIHGSTTGKVPQSVAVITPKGKNLLGLSWAAVEIVQYLNNSLLIFCLIFWVDECRHD